MAPQCLSALLRWQAAAWVCGTVVAAIALHSGAPATAQQRATTPQIPPVTLPTDPRSYQEGLDALGISGYSSAPSVEPGQTIDIMVSTRAAKYKAELVRIIHGDADPRGPGIKEELIGNPANGEYDGAFQPMPLGSYVEVASGDALNLESDFTITAWIAPTTMPGSTLNPIALRRTPVGTPRPQGIVAKWDGAAKSGYGLFIGQDGGIELWLGNGKGRAVRVGTGVKMYPFAPGDRSIEAGSNIRTGMSNFTTWYFVAASYNARTDEVSLYQLPLKGQPNPTEKVVTRKGTGVGSVANEAQLLIGAGWEERQPGGSDKAGLYNGKIDNPRIYNRVLSGEEVAALRSGAAAAADAVASWDFSREMATANVIDTAGGHHGTTVNNPVRAVTSHRWRDGILNFNMNPESYAALYFHEDDIADARWKTSVRFTIPEDARSGVYGARLTAGDDIYHAAFTVRPKRGRHADIAFLVPTFSYLAYAGIGLAAGQYNVHDDGSGVVYSAWARPIVNMRPYTTGRKGEGRPWQFEADTHIFEWLESTGYKVDYFTDHDVHNGVVNLRDYKVVLTGSHPEYISARLWDAIENWLNNGGRLIYMGGNGFYWVPSLDADAKYTELRRHEGTEAYQVPAGEYYHNTTGEFGGLWRYRGRAPQELVGVGFTAQGFASKPGLGDYGRPYIVTDQGRSEAGSWIFKGVKTDRPIGEFASLQSDRPVSGPGGEELDRADYALGTPATALVVATSTGFGDEYVHVVEEVHTSNLMQGGTVNPLVRADMTLMYYPKNGAVWSSSSISWAGSLYYNNHDNDVARITRNVLDMFVSGAPLPTAPGN